MLRNTEKGQYLYTRNNKQFVRVYNSLEMNLTDKELAKLLNIPTSSFCKMKLGYFQVDSITLQRFQNLVENLNGEKTSPTIIININNVENFICN